MGFFSFRAEVSRMMQELGQRLQQQIDAQRSADADARAADAKKLQHLKTKVSESFFFFFLFRSNMCPFQVNCTCFSGQIHSLFRLSTYPVQVKYISSLCVCVVFLCYKVLVMRFCVETFGSVVVVPCLKFLEDFSSMRRVCFASHCICHTLCRLLSAEVEK